MIEAVKAHNPLRAEIEAVLHLEGDKGLCPFHPDKHPSLTVKGDKWRCWSCGEGGDVIDFTRKYYGLDTKGAIKLLADRAGIMRQTSTEAKAAQRERERKQELLRAFREWEQTTVNEIAEVLRTYRHMKATKATYTEAELIELARVQGEMDILEHHYEIFCSKDDESKFGLYQETRNAGREI